MIILAETAISVFIGGLVGGASIIGIVWLIWRLINEREQPPLPKPKGGVITLEQRARFEQLKNENKWPCSAKDWPASPLLEQELDRLRQEWLVQQFKRGESKMTFGEAMTEAALGKTVRRKAWPSQWRVHMLKNALFNHEGMPFIPGSGIYTNDWELYEPKLSVDQKADRYDIIEKVVNGKVEIDNPWAAVKRIVKEGI